MGCDIHLFVEVLIDNKWESVDKWIKNKYDDNDPKLMVDFDDSFYRYRNYSLFSILANVRNGYGFAGIDTGNGFIPISLPRGIPDDVSKNVQEQVISWDSDGHSHSWLLLSELLSYDWTRVTTKRGVLSFETFRDWRRWDRQHSNNPQSWSGDVGGRNVVKITMAQGDRLLERTPLSEEIPNEANTYVLCEWQVPYYKCCSDFLGETIPKLLALGKPYDQVRIVFWFDN